MTATESDCLAKIATLEGKNRELENDIQSLREQMRRTITEASETAEEEIRCLKVTPFWLRRNGV